MSIINRYTENDSHRLGPTSTETENVLGQQSTEEELNQGLETFIDLSKLFQLYNLRKRFVLNTCSSTLEHHSLDLDWKLLNKVVKRVPVHLIHRLAKLNNAIITLVKLC